MKIDEYNDLIDEMTSNRIGNYTFTDKQMLMLADDHFNRVLNHIKADSQEYKAYQFHIEQAISGLESLWLRVGDSLPKLHEDRKAVADNKRGDYTRGDSDVFANFKNQSESLGLRPEQCLAVHMEKQFSAIVNYINTDGESESEPIIKRFGDTMNYLELLYGLIEEKKQQPPLIFESIEIDGELFKASDLLGNPDDDIFNNQPYEPFAGFGATNNGFPCNKCLDPAFCTKNQKCSERVFTNEQE